MSSPGGSGAPAARAVREKLVSLPLNDFPELSLEPERLPRHVAIVMDGNGRWATRRGLARREGHRRGKDSVRAVVDAARELGIPYLTLFAFSSENWQRPPDEVGALLDLFMRALDKEVDELHENNVRLRFIGDLSVPTLVFGDLNAAPDAPELQPLLARLHDAWSGSSPGYTYPAEAPRERIDDVLVSPHFTVRSVRVPETQASDQRPVVADLVLTPTLP